MTARRDVLAGLAAVAAWPALSRLPADSLEAGTQKGWAALDLATGRRSGLNAKLRLPLCSSFKWLLAACVLWRVDRGLERLDRPVPVTRTDLLPASPMTEAAVKAGGGRATMTVSALCAAAMAWSDNAAANLLLARVRGPAGLTRWLRAHGDAVTRLDRTEPTLNDVPRGDPRDSTTAAAIVGDLHRFVYGDVLRPASRQQLLDWLLSCRTGPNRLMAGLPAGWRIDHRTGTRTVDGSDPPMARAAAADIGILLPPRGAPILVAAYAAGWTCPLERTEAWFADIAREVVGVRTG